MESLRPFWRSLWIKDVTSSISLPSSPFEGRLSQRLRAALEQSGDAAEVTVALASIEVRAGERLLAVVPEREPAFVWQQPDGSGWFAAGAAVEILGTGEDRFSSVRTQARDLWPRVRVELVGPYRSAQWPRPRMLGGAAFAPGPSEDPLWRGFGEASFMLPALTVVQDGEHGWLMVAARADTPAEKRTSLCAAAEQVAAEVARTVPRRLDTARLQSRRDSDRSQWLRGVEKICAAVADGRLTKVVSARASDLQMERPVNLQQVLVRLAHECPECTRFVVRRGGVTFVGATPERLVARRGRQVVTQALAGSIPTVGAACRQDQAIRLLKSAKDRGEHRLVVDAIRADLQPLCSALEVPEKPTVMSLRHVLHLGSPIRGELARDVHILELVEVLHPTPAVGGVPRDEALRWIAEEELLERGLVRRASRLVRRLG